MALQVSAPHLEALLSQKVALQRKQEALIPQQEALVPGSLEEALIPQQGAQELSLQVAQEREVPQEREALQVPQQEPQVKQHEPQQEPQALQVPQQGPLEEAWISLKAAWVSLEEAWISQQVAKERLAPVEVVYLRLPIHRQAVNLRQGTQVELRSRSPLERHWGLADRFGLVKARKRCIASGMWNRSGSKLASSAASKTNMIHVPWRSGRSNMQLVSDSLWGCDACQ